MDNDLFGSIAIKTNALLYADWFTGLTVKGPITTFGTSVMDNLTLKGSAGTSILKLGNATSLGAAYDSIEFVRPTVNNCIICSDNFIAPYVPTAGAWVGDAAVGDIVLRTNSKGIRMTVNGGGSTQFFLNNFFKIGGTSGTRVESAANLLYLLVNNANAVVIGTTNTSFYVSGTPIAYIGNISGSQDQLVFTRSAQNPNIEFVNGAHLAYATSNNAWVTGSEAGSLILRTNNKKLCFTTDSGTSSALTIDNQSNVGISNASPIGKFWVKQNPEGGSGGGVGDWNSNFSVFSNGTGSRSAGFGIGFNNSSTSATVFIYSLAPNVSWNSFLFEGYAFYFKSNGPNVFNINYLGTGVVYSNGGTLTSSNPSDIRLKNTIIPLQNNLDIINQLNPVSFLWNDKDKHGSKLQIGFIAQEVQEVLPIIVSEYKEPIVGPSNLVDENGMRIDECITNLGVDTMALIPILTGAIKEQQIQINKQQATIDLLLKHMTELTNQVNNLTKKITN